MRIIIKETYTPIDIGRLLSQHFKYDGSKIIDCFFESLTDANFHTLRAALENTVILHVLDEESIEKKKFEWITTNISKNTFYGKGRNNE